MTPGLRWSVFKIPALKNYHHRLYVRYHGTCVRWCPLHVSMISFTPAAPSCISVLHLFMITSIHSLNGLLFILVASPIRTLEFKIIFCCRPSYSCIRLCIARCFSPPAQRYTAIIVFVNSFRIIRQGASPLHNRASDIKSPASHPYSHYRTWCSENVVMMTSNGSVIYRVDR